MHVLEFLSPFLSAIHVKVVKPGLPKSLQTLTAILKRQTQLSGLAHAIPLSQIPRNALFQHIQHARWRNFGLADEQVHMLGHHYISNQPKPMALSDFPQRRNKDIPGPHRSQQRQPPVAAKGKKMQIPLP